MRHKFTLSVFSLWLVLVVNAQNVGIGTATPLARLHVTDSSVLFSAAGDIPATPHTTPISGPGRRLMWYPDKAAFRVGYTYGAEWDSVNIGAYSIAMGYNTVSSGNYTTAMGLGVTASGTYSTAMGYSTKAIGDFSTAMGNQTTASGQLSTAIGFGATASGDYSIAIGETATASGLSSTAMGDNTTASGSATTAMGSLTTASGNRTTAMGYNVSTNGHTGAFTIGDSDPNGTGITLGGVNDQFFTRFNGGYYLMTSGNTARTGVIMNHGDNSWSAISDSTKKEKILPVDGENFLHKIAQFKLGTWNYKGQDSKTFRHYGPMAQDFYSAFGKDALGTIGTDTLINQQDFLGVSFIAIQALEKRTEKIEALQKQNTALQQQVDAQQQDNLALQQQMQTLLNTVALLNKQVQLLAAGTNNQNNLSVNK